MKKGLSVVSILIGALFILSSFSLRENPQDPPRGKKKHIKMVKIKDGNKVELDTIIEGDNVFVWEGDTIRGDKLKWISKENFHFDSDEMEMQFDIDVTEDGEGYKVIMIKSDGDGDSRVHEFKVDEKSGNKFIFKSDGDDIHKSHKSENVMWFGKDGGHKMIHSQHAPKVKVIKKKLGGNVINLSDPGIILFKKKKLSGGREKIEIIRKEVVGKEMEDIDVIIDRLDSHSMIHGEHPEVSKEIRIVKENGGVFHINKDDANEFNLESIDGELIKIKKIKEGDSRLIHIEEIEEEGGKKIKVTVTEESEEKKETNKEGK